MNKGKLFQSTIVAALAGFIFGFDMVVISGAAHGLMMEHSFTFNKILIEFLQRTELARVAELQPTA